MATRSPRRSAWWSAWRSRSVSRLGAGARSGAGVPPASLCPRKKRPTSTSTARTPAPTRARFRVVVRPGPRGPPPAAASTDGFRARSSRGTGNSPNTPDASSAGGTDASARGSWGRIGSGSEWDRGRPTTGRGAAADGFHGLGFGGGRRGGHRFRRHRFREDRFGGHGFGQDGCGQGRFGGDGGGNGGRGDGRAQGPSRRLVLLFQFGAFLLRQHERRLHGCGPPRVRLLLRLGRRLGRGRGDFRRRRFGAGRHGPGWRVGRSGRIGRHRRVGRDGGRQPPVEAAGLRRRLGFAGFRRNGQRGGDRVDWMGRGGRGRGRSRGSPAGRFLMPTGLRVLVLFLLRAELRRQPVEAKVGLAFILGH